MKISLNSTVVFFILLLIGGDRIAIEVSGFTFRLVFLLLLFGLIIIKRDRLISAPKSILTSCSILLIAGLASIPNGVAPLISLINYIWLLSSALIISNYFYCFFREGCAYKNMMLVFMTYRIFVVLITMEGFYRYVGNDPGYWGGRPYLWFYEPSYAAIYLCFYFGTAFYLWLVKRHPNSRIDLIIASIGLITLQSATGFFACLITLTFVTLSIAIIKNMLAIGLIIAFSAYLSLSLLNLSSNTMVGFLVEGLSAEVDLSVTIINRGGNRVGRLLSGVEAFLSNPLTGIGIGADKFYTQTIGAGSLSEEYTLGEGKDIIGNPFINIFVEVAGTMGIIGLSGFLFMIFKLCSYACISKKANRKEADYVNAMGVGLICMLISMQAEGTFLRFYIWSSIGLFLGATSRRSQAMQHLSEPKS